MKYDLQSVLERYYHGFIVSPEEKYNFSLYIDLEKIAEDEKEKKDLVRSIGLLKRNILSAPFEKAFCLQQLLEEQKNEQDTKNTHKEIIKIPYRDEEAIFIIPSSDRVTVIFSMIFKEETDIILGKVFLQEFVDARKRPAIQNAPQVFYSYRDPPLEIQTLCDLKSSDNIGYVTFGKLYGKFKFRLTFFCSFISSTLYTSKKGRLYCKNSIVSKYVILSY